MKFEKFLSTLTLLFTTITLSACPIQKSPAQPRQGCNPIGRILRADKHQLLGQVICRDQLSAMKIMSSSSSKYRFLCYVNQTISQSNNLSGLIQSCQRATLSPKSCVYQSGRTCIVSKGVPSTLQILDPYSSLMLTDRPRFRWSGIPNASKYRVALNGENLSWVVESDVPQIIYPIDQPGLAPGSQYSFSVVALDRQGDRISSTVVSIIRLSAEEIHDLQVDIQVIQNSAPPSDQFKDLSILYQSYWLLSDGIHFLSDLSKASTNPMIFEKLADLFVQSERLDEAQENYQKALQLAQMAEPDIIQRLKAKLTSLK